jgi:hypothetical protein
MSPLELVVAYLRQRARLRVLVPLSVLMGLTGDLFAAPFSATLSAPVASLQALGLVLAFRVWDDLEDREADRVRHPDRVLVSAPTAIPLYVLGGALSLLSIAPLVASEFALRRLAAIGIAAALLSIWYGARSADRSRHTLGEHILACKYPLIAYAVAPDFPAAVVTPRVTILLVVLYLLICVYEYADDVELRQLFTSRRSAS